MSVLGIGDQLRLRQCCRALEEPVHGLDPQQQLRVFNELCLEFSNFMDTFEWDAKTRASCYFMFATLVVASLKLDSIKEIPGFEEDSYSRIGRIDDVNDLIERMNDALLNMQPAALYADQPE
jgi:hypothetical protein